MEQNLQLNAFLARIDQILIDDFELEAEQLHADAKLDDDLGLDSLDGMDLVVAVEKEFDLKVQHKRMMTMRTLGDVRTFLSEHLA